ncbi:MAG: carboxypeptidase-like regulatory domain-containing protein [Verrucomicrobiaceae bacterium]
MNDHLAAASKFLLLSTSALFLTAGTALATVHSMLGSTVWADVRLPEQLTIISWNTPVPSLPAENKPEVAGVVPGAVTLTVDHDDDEGTPALTVTEIPDDFFGFLDLTIEGLAPGQTVLLEKFRVLPGGAPLMLQGSHFITDGGAELIGKVYNFNLPVDTTVIAEGTIIAQIDYYEPSAASIVGDYLYRISNAPPADPGNPGATFSVDLPVSVVSAEEDAAQGLTGSVIDQDTSQPIPGALVVKMWPLSGYADILSGTTADESGDYFLPSEERNEFDFAATKEGYVGRFGPGTEVNLVEDTFFDHDIFLEKGTRLISGTLKDSETLLPMAGVELFFSTPPVTEEVTAQFFTVTWTDEAGNFSVMVNENHWSILVRGEIAAKLGCIIPSSLALADTTGGSDVRGLELTLKRASSLVHGTLTSTSGPSIFGVEIVALNQATQESAYGVTDEEGRYRLAVTPGHWEVSPFSFSLEDSDHTGVTMQEIHVTGERQSIEHNPTARPAMAELIGVVSDEEGEPIGRLRLLAHNKELTVDEYVLQSTFETDGEYCIFLAEGDWLVFPDPTEVARRKEKLIFIGQPTVTVDPGDPEFDGELEVDLDVIKVDETTPEIELTITDRNTNAPLAGLTLHAFATIDDDDFHSYSFTGADGVAHIPVVSDGNTLWTIHASVEGTRALGKKEIEEEIEVNVTGALTQIAVTTEDFDSEPLPLTGRLQIAEDGRRIFSSNGANGRGYLLESSPDLENWFGMGRARAVDGEIKLIDQSSETSGRRFYRARPE